MLALLGFVLAVLVSPFESKSRLEAENAVLRHQLIVLRRKMKGRVRLTFSCILLATWWDVLEVAQHSGHFDPAVLREVRNFLEALPNGRPRRAG